MPNIDESGDRGIFAEFSFDKKVSASDGRIYSVSEAEEMDLRKMVENSCMRCNRLLGRGEIKIVPPQYVQEQDEYVSSGVVTRRILCTECYERMVSSTRERIRSRYRAMGDTLRRKLFRALESRT